MSDFPNTGSILDTVTGQASTNTGLSTQIVIRVNNQAVGALQSLRVSQNRGLQRISEIGTDGVIEIVPNKATEYEITAERVVFDQLRLPESLSRGFRFISAQRVPFDIDIFDIANVNPPAGPQTASSTGVVVMTYKNCWFTRYETPYAAENYVITESATIWAETAYISNLQGIDIPNNIRGLVAQTDAQNIERQTNLGASRGSLSYSGIYNSIFST